ncbi:nucleoside phosphorylase domain-containing protein [Elsinoe ampelina]|uniref:Nucleoside phosphorylase domain-containing protein n=1 Tax=Elsinoe ampelina TaxID=302913 RepID=A0A6A6G774_9PEZI|nr:nucleoside phosphorylase domain-containing protein [Elsinoe ampelina]
MGVLFSAQLTTPYSTQNAMNRGMAVLSFPSLGDFTIAVVCALPCEMAAVLAMLDEEYKDVHAPSNDDNRYNFGRIGCHNIIIVCLPAGSIGKSNAAVAAESLKRSFPIDFALLAGVGGGVPSQIFDIRLGDVVISQPYGKDGGLVQWDFGKRETGNTFRRTGALNSPSRKVLNTLSALQTRHALQGDSLSEHLEHAKRGYRNIQALFSPPKNEPDELYEATYEHPGGQTCTLCTKSRLVERPTRTKRGPALFYGLIASGDQVMKDALVRDSIARDEDIMCFEMKAAGVATAIPCLVIRGICDYADSHKAKAWQPYAAATAAALAREYLLFLQPSPRIYESASPSFSQVSSRSRPMASRRDTPSSASTRMEDNPRPRSPDPPPYDEVLIPHRHRVPLDQSPVELSAAALPRHISNNSGAGTRARLSPGARGNQSSLVPPRRPRPQNGSPAVANLAVDQDLLATMKQPSESDDRHQDLYTWTTCPWIKAARFRSLGTLQELWKCGAVALVSMTVTRR